MDLGPDLQAVSYLLPDVIFRRYEQTLVRDWLRPLTIAWNYRLVTLYVVANLLWLFIMLLVVRMFPSVLGMAFLVALMLWSWSEGTGILITFYCLFNFVRIVFSPKKLTVENLTTTPKSNFGDRNWFTQDVSGLLVCLIVLVGGGAYFDVFRSELMIVVVAVVTVMLLSKSFPTGGQNSTGNAVVVIIVLLMILFFGTGVGPALTTVISDTYEGYKYSRSNRYQTEEIAQQRPAQPPPPNQPNPDQHNGDELGTYSVLDDIMLAVGSWRDPVWDQKAYGYSIVDLWSMVRFMMGTLFIYSMVIGDLLGPAVAVTEQTEITNKAKEDRREGFMPILKTRWLISSLGGTTFYLINQNWLAGLLCLVSFVLAILWYYVVERRYWIGRGKLASCHTGRNDMVIIRGDGPATCRRMLMQATVAGSVLTMTWIHTSIRLFIFTFVWLVNDERVLSLMCLMTTQCHWYLVGVFSGNESSVTQEYTSRVAAANAKDDPVGQNSTTLTWTGLSGHFVGEHNGHCDETKFATSFYRHRFK